MIIKHFQKIIWNYYRREGRMLPWRETKDSYAILVSEVMLQQTQAERVRGYYKLFLKRFPDFQSLAKAETSEVLATWQGLGYNRRALFLKKLAGIVVEKFDGKLPKDRKILESLPGIGKGTSGAIMAFAFNKPEIFIETNIRRVFIHFFFSKKRKVTDDAIERYIENAVDRKNPREWYWAIMDYGASMPGTNPNQKSAHYKKQSPFAGSERELRGKFLHLILLNKKIKEASIKKVLNVPQVRLNRVIAGLCREGFLLKEGQYIFIK